MSYIHSCFIVEHFDLVVPSFMDFYWPFSDIAPINHHKGAKMKRIINNQVGQSIMEYVIISSLIGIFSLVAMKQFGEVIKKRVEVMKQQISQNIKIN